jgi:hypothetical protein
MRDRREPARPVRIVRPSRRLRSAFHDVRDVEIDHEREVQHVEPDHRAASLVPVLVPLARGREDQVAGLHPAGLAVDERHRALTFDHDPRGVRRMPVAGRDFAGEHQLDAEVDRRRCLQVLQATARIREHEDAPLRLVHRRQLSGAQQQRPDGVPRPMRGQRIRARRFGRKQRAQIRPQRHEVRLRQRRDVVAGQFVEGAERFHSESGISRPKGVRLRTCTLRPRLARLYDAGGFHSI